MLNINHILVPVTVPVASDLNIAQPITFESMKAAKQYAINDVNVNLITTQFNSTNEIAPNYFNKCSDLNRSVQDVNTFSDPNELALIKDVFQKAYESSNDGDYIIYTNVDITLMPHFYSYVNNIIKSGVDSCVITRRTISNEYKDVSELPYMYSELGEFHPGHDCFIFKRDIIKDMVLEHICIGTEYIGQAVYLNLMLLSSKFKKINDKHLTFHIGNTEPWKNDSTNQFREHNKIEFYKIKKILSKKYNSSRVEKIIRSVFN